jgi:hypothetical protein
MKAAAAGTDDGAWVIQADLSPCGDPDAMLRLAVVPRRVRGTTGSVEQWRIVAASIDR